MDTGHGQRRRQQANVTISGSGLFQRFVAAGNSAMRARTMRHDTRSQQPAHPRRRTTAMRSSSPSATGKGRSPRNAPAEVATSSSDFRPAACPGLRAGGPMRCRGASRRGLHLHCTQRSRAWSRIARLAVPEWASRRIDSPGGRAAAQQRDAPRAASNPGVPRRMRTAGARLACGARARHDFARLLLRSRDRISFPDLARQLGPCTCRRRSPED